MIYYTPKPLLIVINCCVVFEYPKKKKEDDIDTVLQQTVVQGETLSEHKYRIHVSAITYTGK